MAFDGSTISTVHTERAPLGEATEQRRSFVAAGITQKIFDWLAVSPNNAGYLDSQAYRLPKAWLDEHCQAIHEYVTENMQAISMDNATVDLYHLEMIHSGSIPHINQYTGAIEPLLEIYSASDFLNAGIDDIQKRAHGDTVMTPVDELRYHAVEAVGAMLVRGIYLTRLSATNTESFPESERNSYLAVFRQNILATIRQAAWLESQQSLSDQQPALQATEQLAVAA